MSLRLSSFASVVSVVAALLSTAACTVSTNLGGSGGSGGADVTSTGATGAGAGTSTTTATAAAASGTGAGGGGACSGYIDFTRQGSASQHFTSSCPGKPGNNESPTAVGSYIAGKSGEGLLRIFGCPSSDPLSAVIDVLALHATAPGVPGLYTDGTTIYEDADGIIWQGMRETHRVNITRYDEPGGAIEGTFEMIAIDHAHDAASALYGSFHVCRIPDQVVMYNP